MPLDAKTLERFWAKVDKNGPLCDWRPELGRCWIWTASVNRGGYGCFSMKGFDGRKHKFGAHRVSYAIENGDPGAVLRIDHLCERPRCVRPNHEQPVTDRVNTLRGRSFSARNIRKDHCIRGHPFAGRNLSVRTNGQHRRCRTCDKALQALRRARVPRVYSLVCGHCGTGFRGSWRQMVRAKSGESVFCCKKHANSERPLPVRNLNGRFAKPAAVRNECARFDAHRAFRETSA